MEQFFAFCKWLQQSPLGTTMRGSLWLFPTVEALHLFGTIALVSSTTILSFRLIGLGLHDEPVSKLARQFLPWAWLGFTVQVITGFLLFSSESVRASASVVFTVKMILILLAGVNALTFQRTVYREVAIWDNDAVTPWGARLAGWASIILWIGIAAAGRWLNSSLQSIS
jgi:Family of unknown function (DUF6644)